MRNIVELKIEETKAVAGGIKVSAPVVATGSHIPVATGSVPTTPPKSALL